MKRKMKIENQGDNINITGVCSGNSSHTFSIYIWKDTSCVSIATSTTEHKAEGATHIVIERKDFEEICKQFKLIEEYQVEGEL